ncbi:lactate utilization protein B/C, partial [bacterium AH-315-P13]|nr:lactate utilization protein B/C [bacterium AH-315-P13]
MSLFRKIFGPKSDDSQKYTQNEQRSKYMPEIKIPVDERFTINFKANGGKFLYCEDLDEVNQNLNSILQENDWKQKK